MNGSQNCCRIVVTGGPGGGKTTAIDLFRREIGEAVVIVPEAASLLYNGGFPRVAATDVRRQTQKAIYQIQKSLEEIQNLHFKNRILLCDRGTIDGAAYWPENGNESSGPDFFSFMGTTHERELARYDAVLFFETAAVGGISIEGGNPHRIETLSEAVRLDQKLKSLWQAHPRFVFIKHETSFLHKITAGLNELKNLVQR